jgi:hypothetical protein
MTMSEPPGDNSIIGSMRPYEWSSEDAVAYEVAIEAINGAIGAYTARIAAEKAKPEPDAAAIERWQAGQTECVRLRRQLDPDNQAQIAEARRHFTALADEVRAGMA